MSVSQKTMAMKARVANHIRKTLFKKLKVNITDDEKIAIFDQIYDMNRDMHWDLNNYKQKRRAKAALQKEREERGYQRKKKTSKEEYEKMLAERYKKEIKNEKAEVVETKEEVLSDN